MSAFRFQSGFLQELKTTAGRLRGRAAVQLALERLPDAILLDVRIPDLSGLGVRSLVRVKRLTDELESAEVLFLTLGRIVEARDSSTHGHCERLASHATALGTSCGLDGTDLIALRRGAFLHDIGKIAIPDRVLLKRSRLTAREYALIKTHPVVGDELCRTIRSLDAVRPIVRHHHERLDGRGYPDGL
jgi:putative two-component system response regulator